MICVSEFMTLHSSGELAQLVECCDRTAEVRGSSLLFSICTLVEFDRKNGIQAPSSKDGFLVKLSLVAIGHWETLNERRGVVRLFR